MATAADLMRQIEGMERRIVSSLMAHMDENFAQLWAMQTKVERNLVDAGEHLRTINRMLGIMEKILIVVTNGRSDDDLPYRQI